MGLNHPTGRKFILGPKLNLGSYIYPLAGWTNVDAYYTEHADLVADVMDLKDYEFKKVAEIYAGHLLEHMEDAPAALRYWRSLLKSGGMLTVTVPDYKSGLDMYLHGQNLDLALDIAYGRGGAHLCWKDIPALGNRMDDENPAAIGPAGALISQSVSADFHSNGFTLPVLMSVMRDAGFHDVRKVHCPELYVADVKWQFSVRGWRT